jgi:hypothetical protein
VGTPVAVTPRASARSGRARATRRPNVLIILVDDLRFDEFGAGRHPYMRTPPIDRIAIEGALERVPHHAVQESGGAVLVPAAWAGV